MDESKQSVDLQVNGYVGVDFNSNNVTGEEIRFACDALRRDGVSQILATVITDSIDDLVIRLRKIVEARAEDSFVADVVRGIHIEGPFLNPEPGYIGAHPTQHAVPADLNVMQRLLDASDGLARIVTLAPECDSGLEVTRWLADQGVTVSAGHCNPSLDQLQKAIDAGLTMFTHLGNGCPLSLHRHDNVIQRVLRLSRHLHVGFIADGVHVPFFALANYLDAVGLDNAFVVTDAVSAAGMGPGTYALAGQNVIVDDALATWAEDKSHLVGSAMTMPKIRENLRLQLKLNDAEVDQLTRLNPVAAISG